MVYFGEITAKRDISKEDCSGVLTGTEKSRNEQELSGIPYEIGKGPCATLGNSLACFARFQCFIGALLTTFGHLSAGWSVS